MIFLNGICSWYFWVAWNTSWFPYDPFPPLPIPPSPPLRNQLKHKQKPIDAPPAAAQWARSTKRTGVFATAARKKATATPPSDLRSVCFVFCISYFVGQTDANCIWAIRVRVRPVRVGNPKKKFDWTGRRERFSPSGKWQAAIGFRLPIEKCQTKK